MIRPEGPTTGTGPLDKFVRHEELVPVSQSQLGLSFWLAPLRYIDDVEIDLGRPQR